MSRQWNRIQLGKACEIILGQSPRSDTYNQDKIGLPFFQGKSEFGSKYAQAKTWCSEPIKIANKNDILISVRAPVGESNLAPGICCIGRGLAALRADQENLLQEFLWHQIEFKKVYLQGISQGSTFDAISGKDLSELQIELPPLPEQKKIAEILSGIDEVITIYEQQAKALASLLQALMREEIFMNTSARMIKIGDICTAQAGGTPDRSVKRYYEGIVPWVKSGEVRGGDILKTDESISEEAVSSSSAKIVPSGSVLVAMYGATAGQTARLRIDATTNQAVLSLNPNTSDLLNDYLYHAVTAFKDRLLLACQGSGQPNLSSGLIKDLEIPLPDLLIQNRISSALNSVIHRTSLLRSKIISTMALKSSVSSDLLSGRKRVTP